MYYVYVIWSKNTGRLYKGCTVDLRKRVSEHNQGKVMSTKNGKPWRVIYYEAHRTKTLARKTEIFYKTSQGRRQLKKKLGLED